MKISANTESAEFTKHKHPVLAVPCPTCKVKAGVWCVRPSEHKAEDLHTGRKKLADKVFIELHGEEASIDQTPDGWVIDPHGYKGGDDRQLEFAI